MLPLNVGVPDVKGMVLPALQGCEGCVVPGSLELTHVGYHWDPREAGSQRSWVPTGKSKSRQGMLKEGPGTRESAGA